MAQEQFAGYGDVIHFSLKGSQATGFSTGPDSDTFGSLFSYTVGFGADYADAATGASTHLD